MENIFEEYSKHLDDSGDHLNNQSLAAYLNLKDMLSEKEVYFIENHIKSCQSCKTRLDLLIKEDAEIDVAAENQIIHKLTNPSVKNETWLNRNFNFLKYAAAVVFVVCIFVIMFYDPDAGKKNITTIRLDRPDTVDIALRINEDSLAEANRKNNLPDEKDIIIKPGSSEQFASNVVLENFINRNIRSEKNLSILYPDLGDTLSGIITFRWQSNSSSKVRLIVVNNKNNIQYETTLTGNALTIDKRLREGLYYWKLELNNNLEDVGKFFIVRRSTP